MPMPCLTVALAVQSYLNLTLILIFLRHSLVHREWLLRLITIRVRKTLFRQFLYSFRKLSRALPSLLEKSEKFCIHFVKDALLTESYHERF